MRTELAFCRGAGSSAIYTFKHALVQDAAYQSLLMRRRQQLHRRILMVLRERFPGRAKAEPEVLAHHATEAGLLDQAVSYWHEAGLRDSYQSASAEAIAHLSRALDLLARLPESPGRHQREIDLQAALGVPLAAVKGRSADETMAAYVRAHELCNLQGGETSQFFTALRGLWTCYRARGQMRMACDLADRLISIARRSGETPLLLEAHHAQWTTQFCLGAWRALCEHTRQGLALYRPEHFSDAFVYGGHDAAVCGTAKEGVSLWMLGYPDKALARVEQSIVLARRLSHAPSILHALFYATVVHHFRGEATAARDTAEAALQIARDQLPSWTPYAELQMSLISALEEKPQARDRIVTIQEALAIGGHSDVEGKGFLVCLFADVCGLAGEAEIGMNALEPAIAEVTATGARLWESELHRIAANLRLSSPVADPERGEIHYRRAIEVAREQQSPSLDLRASTSLARLWADRGERQKAYNLLAPIYATFTEGFGTHDLIEARALINELG